MDFKEAVSELYAPGIKYSLEKSWSMLQIVDMDGVYEDNRVKITKTGHRKYNIMWK